MQGGGQHFEAFDVHRLAHQLVALAGRELALERSHFFFQCLDLLQRALHTGGQLGHRCLEHCSGLAHSVFQGLQIDQCVFTGDSFNTAYTCSHTTFRHHLEQANVTGRLHMGAAAQLAAAANVQHTHHLAVLLAKQHDRTGFLGAVDVHHPRLGAGVGQDFGVHLRLNAANLLGRDRRVVGEVKTGALGIDQRTLLLHMAAQHLAQGLVHDVRDRVVAHGGGALRGVDLRLHRVAHLQAALRQHTLVAKHIGFDFLGIHHLKLRGAGADQAFITDLAAALGIKRRGIEHHHTRFTGLQLLHWCAVAVQRHHAGVAGELVVTHKGVARAAVVQRLVHLELTGCTRLVFLHVHGGLEAGFVHRQTTLPAHIGRQIQREAVGVVQLERHLTRQLLGATCERGLQNLHAVFQRLVKTLFFGLEHLGDALGIGLEVGVGVAHERHQIGHQLVEERRLAAELVTVADGAAHDAALHIAAAFVARDHAVGHQKGGGAQVVGDHAQAGAVQVVAAGFAGGGFDQRVKNVDLVVAVHALQDGGQALQAHAGVHTGRGQRRDRTVFVHLELHEHVVPDLDETVAVFFGAARRAAGDVRAVVVKDFRARATRAGVGHHPEVVALVTPALVVPDADHAVSGQPDFFGPNVVGLVVFHVHGGQQALFGQLVHIGEQLPRPFQAFTLEVIAKAPIAQHFKESVVARGVAHVFQVVVFATGAQAGLYRGGAHVAALVGAQKHVFELHHARVGEHERRVVAWHQRAGRHHGVATLGKKVQKGFANIRHRGA